MFFALRLDLDPNFFSVFLGCFVLLADLIELVEKIFKSIYQRTMNETRASVITT